MENLTFSADTDRWWRLPCCCALAVSRRQQQQAFVFIFFIVFAAGLDQIQTNLAENKIRSNELGVCPSVHPSLETKGRLKTSELYITFKKFHCRLSLLKCTPPAVIRYKSTCSILNVCGHSTSSPSHCHFLCYIDGFGMIRVQRVPTAVRSRPVIPASG